MKKIFALVLALVLVFGVATTALANVGWFDFNYDFKYAIVMLDGVRIEGVVTTWWDFDGSDMIQVEIDGNVILTHSSNVLLCKSKPY